MTGYVNGKPFQLDPTRAKGKGGEADIYEIAPGVVAKIFKGPKHADFAGEPLQAKAAEARIDEHQAKLRDFPKGLPSGVLAPVDLMTDVTGKRIIGYTMPFLSGHEVLLRYSDRGFRATIDNNTMVDIFRDLRNTVEHAHQCNFVFGDFNDLNVLVKGTQARVLDADSGQFGKYLCRVFTEKFVDPLVCDASGKSPKLCRPFNKDSDWYALAVMLMNSLLFVGPYGGLYRPSDPAKRILEGQRPLKRVSVFDAEVRYPKPAVPFSMLDDATLHYLTQVFQKDHRAPLPSSLLENMRWTKCTACGAGHARPQCPNCFVTAPAAVLTTTTIRGRVTATRIFKTTGVILHAVHQHGALKWLYNSDGTFSREDGSLGMRGKVDPSMRYRIRQEDTLMGKQSMVVTVGPNNAVVPQKTSVETLGNRPVFDANEKHTYWVESGRLVRDGAHGVPEYIGDVLSNQTMFWVGNKFGFGFYRAGELSQAFVFDAERRGINDNVKLPRFSGQLVDSSCTISNELAWFTVSTQAQGKTVNQCFCIDALGKVHGQAQAVQGDGTWLGTVRNKCAIGKLLFVATDDGMVRVEAKQGKLEVTQAFPDSEPFVDSSNHLFPGPGGIYVVSEKEIVLLKMA